MKSLFVIVLVIVFVSQSATKCYIKAITQRVGIGEYACITHPCAMPGDDVQYVQEFSDVYVWGEGMIITLDGTLLMLRHVPLWDGLSLPISIPGDVVFEEYGGTIAVLSTVWQDSWYHWLFDLLSRLYILQQSGLEYDCIHIYGVTRTYMADAQQKSLRAVFDYLGIPWQKVRFVGKNVCLHTRKVLRPSYPYASQNVWKFPLWVRDFLRNVFLVNDIDQKVYSSQVYISRADAPGRRVANEEKLMELLAASGFKRVVLSQHTPHEQAAIFNHASVVVAQHGSALANVVYCKPGTRILEIDSKLIKPRMHFKALSEICGLEYKKFEHGAIGQNWHDDQHHCDTIVIDIPEFAKCLKEL